MTRQAQRFGIVLAAIWLGWLAVLLVGPHLVEAAYEERSLPFVNALLSGRDQHELSRYLDVWSRLARRATIGLALLSIGAVALFRVRQRVARSISRATDTISVPVAARVRNVAFVAVMAGLVAGAIEVVHQAVAHTVRAWPTGDFYWDKIWLTPLSMALTTLLAGLLLFPLTRPWRSHATLGVLPAVLGAIAAYAVARAVGGIHPAAAALLATGLVVVVCRVAASNPAAFVRSARRVGLTLTVLIVSFGIGLHGKRSIGELRALASLGQARPGAPNVLMLILDTVRAQSLGLYGHDRPTTPNIDTFAERGVVFDRAWAPAAWTLPSHASLFTGRPASELTTDYLIGLDTAPPTLAEALAESGYATAGFVANFYYASRRSGLARGFAHYEDHPITLDALINAAWLPRQVAVRIATPIPYLDFVPRKRAERITDDFLDWLVARPDRPFFAFLNYLDAHHPYDPPEPFRSRFGGGVGRYDLARNQEYAAAELRSLENHYDGALAYVDEHVGRLFDQLDSMNILDNTIVIITADHGEEFGEHGPRSVMHGRSLYSPVLHVPLIVAGPERVPAGRRVDEPVAIANVPATILDLAGGALETGLAGSSLIRFWESESVAASRSDTILSVATQNQREGRLVGRPIERGPMRSLLVDRWHLIVNGDGVQELYDVFSDPWEQTDLITTPAGAAKAAAVRVLLDRRTAGGKP